MTLSRRASLLLPLGMLSGCAWLDDVFADRKRPIPGRREAILAARRGLEVDTADRRAVSVPAAAINPDWPQAGGTAAHVVGNPAVSGLSPAWRSDIGDGGGYRRKITAQPVLADGRVFTMDSDAVVSAFDAANGGRTWRRDTQGDEDRSTNVGGGVAVANGVLYATTGRAEALALDAATGAIRWRSALGSPARSAPTVVDGHLFVTLLDGRLLSLNPADGERQWAYQAATATTALLGQPAPAYADGLVVAGFGSGDLLAVRADGGALAWSDSLASARGRNSVVDLSAIRGLPVIENGRVFAIGLGGLMVSIDLRSGRRLWEREVGGSETPWLVGDWLFVQTAEQSLAAIHKDDGRVRWVTELPRYGDEARQRDPIFWTGPVMADGRLVLAGSSERMMTVSAADGEVMATQRISDAASVAPIAAAGSVFIVTDDGKLQAFR